MQITVSYQEYVAIVGHLCLVAKLCCLMNISSKVGSHKVTMRSDVCILADISRVFVERRQKLEEGK